MTVKKWDYFTDALLAGQQSHFLFIDFSVYDFYYFCEISGVLFLLFSLLALPLRLGFSQIVRLMLHGGLRLSFRKVDSTESGHRSGSLAVYMGRGKIIRHGHLLRDLLLINRHTVT